MALFAVAVLASACAFLVGHAFVTSRDSFLRSAPGGMVLAACVLIALGGPPTLAGITLAVSTWPDGITPGAYRVVWIALMVAGLLAGMRVWRMRLFSGDARLFRLDESPLSRAESELPLAASLAEALDVLAREKLTQRDIAHMEAQLKRVGARYFHQLPEKQGEVYSLVASHVPGALAADVTGMLLAGAGRRG